MTAPALLSARDLSKEFVAGHPVLDRVSLDLLAGEWLAVSGPSGAGKSTLLQLVAALERPTGGRILFRGRDLAELDLDAYRRDSIGVVFQLHNLLPHLDVRENLEVAMYGTHLSRRRRAQRVDELVAAVDLVDQQYRRPPQLSGGERQRAAIARALANQPQLLLADEPTGSLDQAQVERMLCLLATARGQSGLTVLMVTHDAEVAARADRRIVIEGGRAHEEAGSGSDSGDDRTVDA